MRQRSARYGNERPDRARGDQGEDDAAAQREHEDERGRQDGVLPRLGERAGQRDGRAEDGADRGGPGPAEEGAGPAVAAQPVEPARSEQHEAERRREGDHRRQDAPGQPGRGVADHRHGLHDRAGGDLAERDGVEELGRGHPVVVAYRVRLHQRDDHETAAVGQGAHLERHPRHRQQHPARDRAADQDRQGDDAARPAALAGARVVTRALGGQLDHAAGHQDQRQPLPDRGGRSRSGQQVGHPARRVRASPPARAEQRPARLHGDRRDGGPGAGSGAEHPQRRGTGQEQRRQGQDHDQPGHDERGPADQRAGAAAEPPGAEDRQLGGRRAGEQVAGRDRVLELPCVQPLPAIDAQFPQQLDVGGRAAEADAADPAPLPQHRGQGHPRRRGAGPGGGTGPGLPPVSSGRLTAAGV